MKRYPSIATIKQAFPAYDAEIIRLLMMNEFVVDMYFERYCHPNQYYNPPDTDHKKLLCLNHYLEMHGIEYEKDFSYLNAGDEYIVTIVYKNEQFRIGCLADFIKEK